MASQKIVTPVILIVFNRPDTTQKVFDVIRQVKPSKLLLIADGPRTDRPEDIEKCAAVRKILEKIDWTCEVLKNYSETNLGCKYRVSSGLNWAFELVEEAIILEDDCLPHPDFFTFCQEMLNLYRDDKRIMQISGTNMLGEWKSDLQSYHFSYYGGIWGWATWRRAWQYYDIDMTLWADPNLKRRVKDLLCSRKQYRKRKQIYNRAYASKVDTWDTAWNFARLSQSGLSVVPSKNLIANIGFRADATHTQFGNPKAANLPLHSLQFPIQENSYVVVDREYDRKFFEIAFGGNLCIKVFRRVHSIIKRQLG